MLAGDNGVPENWCKLAGQMFADIDKARLSTLCDQAEQRMCVIADAIGIAAQDRTACWRFGRTAAGARPADARRSRRRRPTRRYHRQQGLAAAPAARSLRARCATELFLALRESLRILFDLNHVAFLLCDPLDGRLTGKGIGGQPAIFAHVQASFPRHTAAWPPSPRCRNVICSSFDREPLTRQLAAGPAVCPGFFEQGPVVHSDARQRHARSASSSPG
jgi:hypothetical protein